MTDYIEKKCPKCGQQLRLPGNIGGMLMACPSCGNKFHSDFKLGCTRKSNKHLDKLNMIFGLPYEIMRRICRFFFP